MQLALQLAGSAASCAAANLQVRHGKMRALVQVADLPCFKSLDRHAVSRINFSKCCTLFFGDVGRDAREKRKKNTKRRKKEKIMQN